MDMGNCMGYVHNEQYYDANGEWIGLHCKAVLCILDITWGKVFSDIA